MISDLKARSAKPREKGYKLYDQGGLCLFVSARGAKSWRYNYRISGKRETLTIGRYPELSLAEARLVHAEARSAVAHGDSPVVAKRSAKRALRGNAANTFRALAQEWYHAKAPHRSTGWRESNQRWLTSELYPTLGAKVLTDITPADVLGIMRRIENRGVARTAGSVRLLVSQVFQHAIRNLRASYDPAQSLKGALIMPEVKHRAALPAKDIPIFLDALDAYPGTLQTKLGIKLLLLTFVRKRELIEATWDEVDLAIAEWRIPAERMKMRDPHVVPLSQQALECFRDLKPVACGSRFVLPSLSSLDKPVGRSTFNMAFSRMGYGGRFAPHGFRATACTILNEQGFKPDVIERQLAHTERNRIRAAYNRAEYLDERRAMMQAWADYIDALCCGGNVVGIRA